MCGGTLRYVDGLNIIADEGLPCTRSDDSADGEDA
jgi:hypothetical protein